MDSGRREGTRLRASLKAGGLNGVVIVSRFNGHSVVRGVRALCGRLGVPVQIVEGAADVPDAVEHLK